MGSVVDNNEAMRCEYISTILHIAISFFEGLSISPQMNVSGSESSDRVDYAIKKIIDDVLEKIIEGKQNLLGIGVAQNIMQCKKFVRYMMKKKRKSEYVYGIVPAGTSSYIQPKVSTPQLKPNTTSYSPKKLSRIRVVKRVLEVIVGLLKDRER
ncbi:9953_t:CDS:2 [Ambispora gerdemannii]|uniref:9953_t:CDS:1 n=1 Tax=Ambispora gerdemannii TaxID=144530 RepID=A0A9N9BDN5_9GLOM|nr:9953_t:CDS:2 [Ambispora gerdemannii]